MLTVGIVNNTAGAVSADYGHFKYSYYNSANNTTLQQILNDRDNGVLATCIQRQENAEITRKLAKALSGNQLNSYSRTKK